MNAGKGSGGRRLKGGRAGEKSLVPTNQKKKHQSGQIGTVARNSPGSCGYAEGKAFDHSMESRWRTAVTNEGYANRQMQNDSLECSGRCIHMPTLRAVGSVHNSSCSNLRAVSNTPDEQ